MKKRFPLIIGSIIAIFILMICPSIPAVTYQNVVSTHSEKYEQLIGQLKDNLINKIQKININSLIKNRNEYNIDNTGMDAAAGGTLLSILFSIIMLFIRVFFNVSAKSLIFLFLSISMIILLIFQVIIKIILGGSIFGVILLGTVALMIITSIVTVIGTIVGGIALFAAGLAGIVIVILSALQSFSSKLPRQQET